MNKVISVALLGAVFVFSSCKDEIEGNLTPEQKEAVNDQSLTEAYFNEAGDMSTMAYNTPESDQLSGGRTRGAITITVEGDTRFNGAIVTLEPDETSPPRDPKGLITIDFGSGQTDPKGVVRKGKILILYQGIRFLPGSTTMITFEGFSVNGVTIEGTRLVETTSLEANPSLTIASRVTDIDGRATFADGTTITRNAIHTHTIVFGGTAETTTWTVTGQATGKTRTEAEYSFVINRAFVFRLDCALEGIALPAEGEALFTFGQVPIVINYGSEGAHCDKSIEVTVSGVSQTVTVN